MDPADPKNLKHVVSAQGILVARHEQIQMMDALHGLSTNVSQLSAQLNHIMTQLLRQHP